MRNVLLVVAAFTGTTALHAQSVQLASGDRDAASVAIVGSDYAFLRPPATLPAGRTLFSFENRGKVRHEMILVRLKPGVTPEELVRAATRVDTGGREMVEHIVGILIIQPGDSTSGRLLVDLVPDRSYALVCRFRDKPDALPHSMMGMVAALRVTPRPR